MGMAIIEQDPDRRALLVAAAARVNQRMERKKAMRDRTADNKTKEQQRRLRQMRKTELSGKAE